MEKILVISYFFPPCNLTASARAASWAEHLSACGYFPIVVTRNWDVPVTDPFSTMLKSGDQVVVKTNNLFEVRYTPFLGSPRDKFVQIFGTLNFSFFRRILTFLEQYSKESSFFNSGLNEIEKESILIIKKNPDIKKVIITANPFSVFKIGYNLHKRFGIKWIADYRDDWTTSEVDAPKDFLSRSIYEKDKVLERKWINSSALFTTVSPHYVKKISNFTGVKGHVIFNGFSEKDIPLVNEINVQTDRTTFSLLYNGSLYPTQEVEPFFKAILKLIEKFYSQINIKLIFLGTGYDPVQKERILNLMQAYPHNVTITNRMNREKVLELQKSADVLLMFSHKNIKGIPSSKIFEYMLFGKSVLLCPSDNDILEEITREIPKGIIANTEEECFISLKKHIEAKLNSTIPPEIYVNEVPWKFSRKNQAIKLAELLDNL